MSYAATDNLYGRMLSIINSINNNLGVFFTVMFLYLLPFIDFLKFFHLFEPKNKNKQNHWFIFVVLIYSIFCSWKAENMEEWAGREEAGRRFPFWGLVPCVCPTFQSWPRLKAVAVNSTWVSLKHLSNHTLSPRPRIWSRCGTKHRHSVVGCGCMGVPGNGLIHLTAAPGVNSYSFCSFFFFPMV